MILTKLFKEFFNSEKAGGLVLVLMAVISVTLANSPWATSYTDFWDHQIQGHSVLHWINDGLMTLFFLLIGLELEREIFKGELRSFNNAVLPLSAAIGGMVIPVAIFTLLNHDTVMISGAGIPMATDIAFAIGILSIMGKRVPASLKVFLTALAVVDDLGAIIIISVFYAGTLSIANLLIALGIFTSLIVLNRLKVYNLLPYLAGGVIIWIFMARSGIHPTITGVLLAFAIPFGNGDEKSPSFILQHLLHKPVAYFILPLFALANTCLSIDKSLSVELNQNYSIGIILGLVAGKPLGIFLFSILSVIIGLGVLPSDIRWKNVLGVGFLGGIGFTMSIFISLLAFDNPETVDVAKLSIFVGSILSGLLGLLILSLTLKPVRDHTEIPAS